MALKIVKGNLERMFDKNLTDLVRGIRNNKENEAKYISQCMEDIKLELRQDNVSVKSNAIAKLTYLQMLGYDISWAGFNIIEVMSSNKFTYKRIGYLSASQSFHCDSELLMLTTNMIRKELNSQNQYECGLALTSLSCYISADLARDLANDILTLLSSTKPYIRKKAVLMLYKVFLKFPEALRPAFPRLKEKLEDPDPGVQSAAVNVVCELARKNPKNYLSLAPVFFKLMTTSTNNWMLIKIIKLFGCLTLIDPGVGIRLSEPLVNIIASTSAMSLLYECINTVIAVLISISSGMPNHAASIQLCVQKLRILIEDSDQNLKYLGLLAMSKILKTHPKSVQTHKDLILQCLEDKDESIRLRALDLLYGMVSKKNLMEIVKKLMVHMDKAEGTAYRDELLSKIVQICSQNSYQFITSFEWYITVLIELAGQEFGSRQGKVLATQLVDVCVRVHAIRDFAVRELALLIEQHSSAAVTGATMHEVLLAAAFLVGEFGGGVQPEAGASKRTIEHMLAYNNLPSHIHSVFIQNILKLSANLIQIYDASDNFEELVTLCELLEGKLGDFVKSAELEVQERASTSLVIVRIVKEEILKRRDEGAPYASPGISDDLCALFSGELNPVAPKAQKKVPIPDGLDLDSWINAPLSDSDSASEIDDVDDIFLPKHERQDSRGANVTDRNSGRTSEPSQDEINKMREARKQEQLNNPHYLKGATASKKLSYDSSDIPGISELSLSIPLRVGGEKRSDRYLNMDRQRRKAHGGNTGSSTNAKKTKKKGKVSKRDRERDSSLSEELSDLGGEIVVNQSLELPEGATLSDDSLSSRGGALDDPHRALNIDLDTPLDDDLVTNNKTPKVEKMKKTKKHKKKNKTDKSAGKLPDVNLLGDVEPEVEKKAKKKDKKDKKKDGKSSKTKKSKIGYEEAAGISTPSTEFQ